MGDAVVAFEVGTFSTVKEGVALADERVGDGLTVAFFVGLTAGLGLGDFVTVAVATTVLVMTSV